MCSHRFSGTRKEKAGTGGKVTGKAGGIRAEDAGECPLPLERIPGACRYILPRGSAWRSGGRAATAPRGPGLPGPRRTASRLASLPLQGASARKQSQDLCFF